MKVKVSYFGHLREVAGVKEEEFEVDERCVVGDLLEEVGETRGIAREIFGEDPSPEMPINVLVDGRNIRYLKGLNTPLSEGSRVALFPPTGGG